jgi:hypothetical protein
MVVLPPYVLVFVSDKVPPLILIKDPLAPERTPLRVIVDVVTLTRLPEPRLIPFVKVNPVVPSNVFPAPIVIALVDGIDAAEVILRVPACMLVAPPYVLVFVSCKMPPPSFVKDPLAPERTPLRVRTDEVALI